MPQIGRAPPGGYGRRSGSVAVATSFDTSRDNDTHSEKQVSRRSRRWKACGPRPLGPGERAANNALQRQRNIRAVHDLGRRAFDELLIEIGTEFGITAFINQKIERYAGLDPEAVRLVGGDRFPPVPIYEVSS